MAKSPNKAKGVILLKCCFSFLKQKFMGYKEGTLVHRAASKF